MTLCSVFLLILLCGIFVNSQDPVIVGGRDARPGEYPYQLLLEYNGRFTCGASLTNVNGMQVAITAAHCLHNRPTSSFRVTAGELNRKRFSGTGQIRQVSRAVLHEGYNEQTIENDIAILFFETPFQINSYVGTIPLPSPFQSTSGNVVITGWGFRNSGRSVEADHLQTITLPVLSDSVCHITYSLPAYSSLLCIGRSGSNQGTCNGDSGGPARSESGHLVGVTSFASAEGCGIQEHPDGFTEVSHFVDWINQQVM